MAHSTTASLASLAAMILSLSAMVPVSVMAEEAISTATRQGDGGAPPPPANDPLKLSGYMDDDGPGFLRPSGPCGGPPPSSGVKGAKSPHGEVWAGVGTSGYREIGGAACMPLGDTGALNIAIDAGHVNGWSGWGHRR
jgi:hypothetical protein